MMIPLYSSTGSDDSSKLEDKFALANPNPVLSSGADGELLFVNPAAINLRREFKLKTIDALLPDNHKGLVKACLKTGAILTSECNSGGHNIAWSYQASDEGEVVYLYGVDISKYKSKASNTDVLPDTNPEPVILMSKNGAVKYNNSAVTRLLEELVLPNIIDLLPMNHYCLLEAVANTSVPLTEERNFDGRLLVWTYKLSETSKDVCIYGHDIDECISKIFSVEGIPRTNSGPVLSTDIDGVPKYINYATSKIVNELELNSIEDILPKRHASLVRACVVTDTPLSDECIKFNRSFMWSYHPVKDSRYICIYGQDVTEGEC